MPVAPEDAEIKKFLRILSIAGNDGRVISPGRNPVREAVWEGTKPRSVGRLRRRLLQLSWESEVGVKGEGSKDASLWRASFHVYGRTSGH